MMKKLVLIGALLLLFATTDAFHTLISPRGNIVSARFRTGVSMNAEPPSSSSSSSLLSLLCPLLKLVSNTDPTAPRNEFFESASTQAASMARFAWGRASVGRSDQPKQALRLYEFEACPFCRRVRDLVTYLDLEMEVRPCPKSSVRHRKEVLSAGGREMFPYLEDPNTGVKLYESEDIVNYLIDTYGNGASLPPLLLESTLLTGWVPTLLRAGRGMTRFDKAKDPPSKLLELYSFESNGECRLVREALCELEMPYKLVSSGEGSVNSKAKLEALGVGVLDVPVLVDSNTGEILFGSSLINGYLFRQYVTQQ